MGRADRAPGAHGRFKPKEPSQSINDPDRPVYITLHKNFRAPQKLFKTSKYYIKTKKDLVEMKKNSGEIFESVQVDPINGDYYLVIPESIANELSWYEDTEISFKIEGDEVILSERAN